jgi:hypothetical protein
MNCDHANAVFSILLVQKIRQVTDMATIPHDVRFTPESGHSADGLAR